MLACVDVDYRDGAGCAVAACVAFADWADPAPLDQRTVVVRPIAPYVPGRFYERELPCLLRVLDTLPQRPGTIVVDGYVWLGDATRPGLGAHLFRALGEAVPVVGVAKTAFAGASLAVEVRRGASATPLFVTSAGIDVATAAARVRSMHGKFRIPTLLKRVDRLCRDAP